MCGIVGITDETISIVEALQSLAHRGQSGCGISVLKENIWSPIKTLGGPMSLEPMSVLRGKYTLGHTRYPTTGDVKDMKNLQPIVMTDLLGDISFVFNGNVFNYEGEESCLRSIGVRFKTDGDTERLGFSFLHRLQQKRLNLQPDNLEVCFQQVLRDISTAFQGSYSCIASSPSWGMIAFRDPYGIRPLEWGITPNGKAIFASETITFPEETIHRGYVPAGGYIWVDSTGYIHQGQYDIGAQLTPDAFEYLYFGHPDSVLNGVSVRQVLQRLGESLARKSEGVWPDRNFLVVPVPKTSWDIAPTLATIAGWEYSQNTIRVNNSRRTFIEPTQASREEAVRAKFSVQKIISNKPVLLVEDSIVRGTTLKILIQMVRKAGAKEVYVASACPPVIHPDFYGIAMPTYKELVAHNRSDSEVCQFIGADGLLYLEVDEMQQCILVGAPFDEVSMPYLDGVYRRGQPSKKLVHH